MHVTSDEVAELGDNLSSLLRTFARARSQFLAAAEQNVEWSAHLLIARIVKDGPLRVSALAECVQSDVSTVSRQVAALVKDGIVERRADPVDGRATLLIATDRARVLYADHVRLRDEHFARVLADWTVDECQAFSEGLARFTADFERHRIEWPTGSARPGWVATPLAESEETGCPPWPRPLSTRRR